MHISEIIKCTGLTKKAIRYYEQEGLIKPKINKTNKYREYTEADLNKLTQISILRQLDFSVKNIQMILDSPEEWQVLLQNHYVHLSEESRRIEKNKNVIETCLNTLDQKHDLSSITRQLTLLNQSLELSSKEREGYIQKTLLRIFPGYFGKMMVMHFRPFLNEPIDSPEKESAWLELVTFLDEMKEVEYPEKMKIMLDQLPDGYLSSYQEHSQTIQHKMISPTEEELEEQKQMIEDFLGQLRDNPEVRSVYQENIEMNKVIKEQLSTSGYYQKFVENLKILSEKYRKYHETLLTLDEQLDLTEIEKMYGSQK